MIITLTCRKKKVKNREYKHSFKLMWILFLIFLMHIICCMLYDKQISIKIISKIYITQSKKNSMGPRYFKHNNFQSFKKEDYFCNGGDGDKHRLSYHYKTDFSFCIHLLKAMNMWHEIWEKSALGGVVQKRTWKIANEQPSSLSTFPISYCSLKFSPLTKLYNYCLT